MKNTKMVTTLVAVVMIGSIVSYIGIGGNSRQRNITEKIYVAVEEAGDIAVIDAETKKVVKRIDLTEEKEGTMVSYMPHNVQVAPDNKSVWVTANVAKESMKMSFNLIPRAQASTGHEGDLGSMTMNEDEVIVIDPFSDTIIKRIKIGQDTHLSHVSISPDSSFAIVAAQAKGLIYKINTATFNVERQVATLAGGEPHGLRVSPDGKTVYIAMLNGKSLGVLDAEDFILSYVPLRGAAVQTAVTSDGKYALASVYDAKSLAVYDVASHQLSYVDLPQDAKGPVQIYPTPDSRYVFAADQGFYFGKPVGDSLYKIDLSSMRVVQTVKAGTAPHGVVVSRDGNMAYITNLKSDDVSVVSVADGKEIARVSVGTMPNGISVWYSYTEGKNTRILGGGNYSELVSKERVFDLGDVSMVKGEVGHSFSVRNTGNTPVAVTRIYTSCMCTSVSFVNGEIRKGPFGMRGHSLASEDVHELVQPGDSFTIEAIVDPAAHGPAGVGRAQKIIYVETDSAITPTLKLELDINVTP